MPKHFILGIDEVGRGPWAGPLVMGGCILPEHDGELSDDLSWINDLTDSKKLSRARREKLAEVIRQKSIASATGWVHASELNKIGLSAGLRLACRRVVENIKKQNVSFQEIIIDGPINFLKDTNLEKFVTNLNKADLLIKEVSAASIIAKVEHDAFMYGLAQKYPEYGFENHVGYGTAAHIAAIEKYGITPEHRTFIKRLFGMKPTKTPAKNTTAIGSRAEQVVADFLEQSGHKILARNYKTKYYEIDIISQKSDVIYFTEVKYRKIISHGSGLESITSAKQKQMKFAAELYCQNLNKTLQPRLAAAQVSGVDFQIDDWFEL